MFCERFEGSFKIRKKAVEINLLLVRRRNSCCKEERSFKENVKKTNVGTLTISNGIAELRDHELSEE